MSIKMLRAFTAGLLSSMLISFFHVYHSNIELADTLRTLTNAGHLVIPQGEALSSLNYFFSAIGGSIFLVMTAGITIIWLAIAAFTVLTKLSLKKRCLFYFSFWGSIAFYLGLENQSFITILHTTIPSFFIYFFLRGKKNHLSTISLQSNKITNKSKGNTSKNNSRFIISILTISLAASFFYLRGDAGIFLRIRDYLLLDTSVGKPLNDFYYQYTLYAAEAIKSPLKKQIKAFWMDPNVKRSDKLTQTLRQYGWFRIWEKNSASLLIVPGKSLPVPHGDHFSNNMIILKNRKNSWYFKKTPTKGIQLTFFLKNPKPYLKSYSRDADAYKLFRHICTLGLTAVLPVFLFCLFFFTVLRCIEFVFKGSSPCGHDNGFIKQNFHELLSAMLMISLFTILFFYLHPFKSHMPFKKNNADHKKDVSSILLDSNSRRMKVEALRWICRTNKREHSIKITGIEKIISKGSNAEKYWLANALALTDSYKRIDHLKTLSQDPSINVKCAALISLDKTGYRMPPNRRRKIISFLEKTLKQSDSWYVQRAAYRGIR